MNSPFSQGGEGPSGIPQGSLLLSTLRNDQERRMERRLALLLKRGEENQQWIQKKKKRQVAERLRGIEGLRIKWQMTFEPNKCKLMDLGKKKSKNETNQPTSFELFELYAPRN